MTPIRIKPVHLFTLFLAAAFLCPQPMAAERDPKAEVVAREMMEAMGGADAWNNAHFVRFDFIVKMGGQIRADRGHLWDKYTGRYRLEQTVEGGKAQVVLFNVNDRSGDVYVDGRKLSESEAAEPLEKAYGAFINDMYWLAMPWKWFDPGVNLKYLGERQRDGRTYDVVELTFEGVGLTPGDTYHAFVDKHSHLMSYWEYTLQSDRKGAWTWEYGEFNGVTLATNHTNPEGGQIDMGAVAVFDEVSDSYFTDPSQALSNLD